MKKYIGMGILALIGGTICTQAQGNDTLKVELDSLYYSKYTVAVQQVQITDDEGFNFVVSNQRGRGTSIHISKNQIWGYNGKDSTLIAEGLAADDAKHNYTLIKNASTWLQLYRDNILVGITVERSITDTSMFALVNTSNLAEGFSYEVVSSQTAEIPDEKSLETNIGNMLLSDELKNLVGDPYCNHGFDRAGLNSETRSFYTNNASFTGWGPEVTVDTENAYSGPYCIKLSGQAVYPDQGASLDQPVKLSANTSYLIRVMVKSNGYEGKLGITGENDYIRIKDTKGEWKQIEGILSTGSTARTSIYLNNADYVNNGTIYVDNFEVYETYATSSRVPITRTSVAGVKLDAGEVWSPYSAKEVYWVNFKASTTKPCSEIDPEKVTVKGSVSYTRPVVGSRHYALSFPGDLQSMTVTGKYDRYEYVNEPMILGVDYVMQAYDSPRFNYLEDDATITSGCYIAQFIDNIDGLEVTMNFSKEASGTTPTTEYRMVGNPNFASYQPEGTFLKFDESKGSFVRTQNEKVAPFEAYIETDAYNPVYQIVPAGVTSFKRLTSEDGKRMSVYSTRGAIVINSLGSATVDIYSTTGMLLKSVQVNEGSTSVNLPQGLYIVGKQKVIVR